MTDHSTVHTHHWRTHPGENPLASNKKKRATPSTAKRPRHHPASKGDYQWKREAAA
ncbi:hypothetical protein [Amycolatopsis plumensis]|uniref:hypothetical protein n=1 Tax=Amycolatopsis plumensis TaxID=236508 RepID=UPI003610F402